MNELAKLLNDAKKKEFELSELKKMGVLIQAATTRTTSFIGIFKGSRVYAYFKYNDISFSSGAWIVERA